MDWIDRLNGGPNRLLIGGGRAELLHWAYEEHLPSNGLHRHTYFEICLVGRHGLGTFLEPVGEHVLEPATLFVARPGAMNQILNRKQPLMELYWVSIGWSS